MFRVKKDYAVIFTSFDMFLLKIMIMVDYFDLISFLDTVTNKLYGIYFYVFEIFYFDVLLQLQVRQVRISKILVSH